MVTKPAPIQPFNDQGKPYDRQLFLADLSALGFSQRAFALAVGTDPGTVYHWGLAPKSPFPRWVPILLAAWRDNQRLSAIVNAPPPTAQQSLATVGKQLAALRHALARNNIP